MLGASAALGWLVYVYPKKRAPGQGRTVELILPAAASAQQVGAQLASKGAVAYPQLWPLYARIIGADKRFLVGTVLLQDNMSVREVVGRVAQGFGSVQVRVTIPEGFSRFEIARLLERWRLVDSARFLQAVQDRQLLAELGIEASSAEGYLFPDTYLLTERGGAPALVRRMVLNWRRRVTPLFDRRAQAVAELKAQLGWGIYQILTLASIVEKEAAVASERPVIAGVFLNRLLKPEFRPKRLQADPTVTYGCLVAAANAPSCAGDRDGHLTHEMLADNGNPYNTYRLEGLPPGPIANPGLDAITAVLIPTKHDYLYFVANGGGRHHFSTSIAAHNQAVHAPVK